MDPSYHAGARYHEVKDPTIDPENLEHLERASQPISLRRETVLQWALELEEGMERGSVDVSGLAGAGDRSERTRKGRAVLSTSGTEERDVDSSE